MKPPGCTPPERPTAVSSNATTRARLDRDRVTLIGPDGTTSPAAGTIDWTRIDATDEAELARQAAADEAEAREAVAAHVRHLRQRSGLSQPAFARRLNVPVETLRNWEQGKKTPRGPARALLRIIDKAPDAAWAALAEG